MSLLNRKSPYIYLILLLILAFLIFSIWSARQAAIRGSQVSDHNYYSKGLKYNNTRVEERAAASRGWQLETVIKGKTLQFRLGNDSGAAIRQATGELTLYLSAEHQVLQLPTTETESGLYLVKLPEGITGNLQARIEFEQQGARVSRQLLVNF